MQRSETFRSTLFYPFVNTQILTAVWTQQQVLDIGHNRTSAFDEAVYYEISDAQRN